MDSFKEQRTDNEVIAEFMGFFAFEFMPVSGKRIYKLLDDKGNPVHPYYGPMRSEQMRFDSSWDWLMPVVEKINQKNQATIYETQYDRYGWYCHMNLHPITGQGRWSHYYYGFEGEEKDLHGSKTRFIVKSKINAIYKSVVEFIRWYNTITPKS